MTLQLARITVRTYTQNGRVFVKTQHALPIRINLYQLAGLLREASFIKEYDQ